MLYQLSYLGAAGRAGRCRRGPGFRRGRCL